MQSPVRALFPLALLAAAGAGCGGATDFAADEAASPSAPTVPVTTAVPVAPPPTTAKAVPSFRAPDGRFSAKFPTTPVRAEQSGGGLTFVFYADAIEGRDVAVGFVDHPKAKRSTKEQLAFLRGWSDDEGTTQVSDTTFLGQPAVDSLRMRVEEGKPSYRHQRAVMVENRMYFLTGTMGTPAAPPEYATLLATFTVG